MSADKYPSIFSRQMEAIVYILVYKKIEILKYWYCNYYKIIVTNGNVNWLIDRNKILYRGC